MPQTLTYKILESHLRGGRLAAGKEISVQVDQLITQDATGTVAYLQFEALGLPRLKVPLAVQYVDHNTLETTPRNRDDHAYLQGAAAKYGAHFSPAGNGIIHQVHQERFARPGELLIGSDSHCCNAGAMAMFALGAGGLDIAQAMATGLFFLRAPHVVRVWLEGDLTRPWVAAMDVMLELLRRVGVRGGLGKAYEFDGPGVKTLSFTERATIANMGIENGSTATLFPSDERTLFYLRAQGRERDHRPLSADPGAAYDEEIHIDLSSLGPMIAKPHNPDQVVPISECSGVHVDQVCVGSCTNSSVPVMKQVAALLDDRSIAPHLEMLLTPGSRQVLEVLARDGDLLKMVRAGVRVLEAACGPCVGMGGSPGDEAVTVRSFNRNFRGRSGTKSARMYLCNPIAATAIALVGEIRDPRELGFQVPVTEEPGAYPIPRRYLIPPAAAPNEVQIHRSKFVREVPVKAALEADLSGEVLLKLGDNVSTDDIMPAGARILPLRSDVPAISQFVFERIDPTFPERAQRAGSSFVVAGQNYGQGSSREHAALAPMYLGMKGVLVKSIARIHRANLLNYGLVPFELEDEFDYERIDEGDRLSIPDIQQLVRSGAERLRVINDTKGRSFFVRLMLTPREREVLLQGGLLSYLRKQLAEGAQIFAGGEALPAEPCH